LTCSDVFGNSAGDGVGCGSGHAGVSGNLSADPRFCDPGGGDCSLHSDSPCAPLNNPACGLVGALGVACGPILRVCPDGSGDFLRIQEAIHLLQGRPGGSPSSCQVAQAAGL
jgi:hypothetical protein